MTIEVKLESSDADPTATVLRAIAGQVDKVKDAIVRLNLVLPEGMESQLRDNDLRDALKEAYFFTVARDVQSQARVRMGIEGVEGLTPLDALRKYLEVKSTPPDRMKILLEYGQKVVEGGES